jgi:hypothetical protein
VSANATTRADLDSLVAGGAPHVELIVPGPFYGEGAPTHLTLAVDPEVGDERDLASCAGLIRAPYRLEAETEARQWPYPVTAERGDRQVIEEAELWSPPADTLWSPEERDNRWTLEAAAFAALRRETVEWRPPYSAEQTAWREDNAERVGAAANLYYWLLAQGQAHQEALAGATAVHHLGWSPDRLALPDEERTETGARVQRQILALEPVEAAELLPSVAHVDASAFTLRRPGPPAAGGSPPRAQIVAPERAMAVHRTGGLSGRGSRGAQQAGGPRREFTAEHEGPER